MTDVVSRLEALAAKLSSGAGGAGGGDSNAVVEAYDAYYSAHVAPFVATCRSLPGSKNLGDFTETAFKTQRKVFEAAAKCKKPDNGEFFKFIDPIVQVVTGMEKACDRKSEFYNHQKAYAEMIPVMNWLIQPLPKPFILGQIEAADFYLTKVLTTAKDKPDAEKKAYRAYVTGMKAMIKELANFAFAHCKTGVEWNPRGVAIKDFKSGGGGGGGGGATKSSAASSSPAGKKMPAEPMSPSLRCRLEAICKLLEAVKPGQAGGNAGGADGAGGGDSNAIVEAYDAYYSAHVAPFVATCRSLPGSKNLGDFTETAFKTQRKVFEAAAKCKKPDNGEFFKFIDPIVQVVTGMEKACDRKSEFYNHQKAYAEMIPVMNWLIQPLPKPFILGQIEAADFYLTKVLTTAKDKPDAEKKAYRAYVTGMKAMIKELANFAFAHCKTGVEWNPRGVAIKDFK